jgi:hypothetical protein
LLLLAPFCFRFTWSNKQNPWNLPPWELVACIVVVSFDTLLHLVWSILAAAVEQVGEHDCAGA